MSACAPPAASPVLAEAHRETCDSADTERLVVDWSPLDRSKLEASARRGVVPVRLDGCRARIVDGCSVGRGYTFVGTSRQREVMRLEDRDEVDARLPMLATRFGASLEHASKLDVTMTVIGRYESSLVARSELVGDCDEATHVVANLSVGAFEIAAARSFSAGANVDGFAHAGHASTREHLDSAGVEAACEGGKRSDAAPPDDCSIPLRVELRPLRAAAHESAMPAMSATPPPASTPESMQHSVDAVKKELEVCHRIARARAPDMSGALTLSVKLARDGNVRSVGTKVEGNLDERLASCAIERVGLVRFPAGDDDRPRMVVIPALFQALARR